MPEPTQPSLFPDQASLTRITPERNEWRFYHLAIWPDLFGRALLARHWGRIGTPGRIRLDPHPNAGAALNVLATLTRSPVPPAVGPRWSGCSRNYALMTSWS